MKDNLVHIGYVKGFHGLKGELKIKCTFERPDLVLKIDNTILLNKEPHKITSLRLHKDFYLITIDGIYDINMVEIYKGYDVYINRDDLKLEKGDYLIDDLYNMEVRYKNEYYGKVKDIIASEFQKTLEIDYNRPYMIPLVDKYIQKVDTDAEIIEVDNIEELLLCE